MLCSVVSRLKVCRRVDSSEAHAERAVLREQLDRAYDVLKLKRTEERNMVQDVAQVAFVTKRCDVCLHGFCAGWFPHAMAALTCAGQTVLFE
jgi:hypothetical protein